MRYRKKSIAIEAVKLNHRGLIEEEWFWDAVTSNKIIIHNFGKHNPEPAWCEIITLEGVMTASPGDYIIKGVNDELYPCKSDIFEKTYEQEVSKMDKCCICCIYYVSSGNSGSVSGTCRLKPPVGGDGFPVVKATDWCGSHCDKNNHKLVAVME